MNNRIIEILTISSLCGRRTGKTTAICKAAKEIGATVICANGQQAKLLAREYDVKTAPLAAALNGRLRGTTGPYLYDHWALEVALSELNREFATEINKLKSDYKLLEEEFNMIFLYNTHLENKILNLKKKKRKKYVRNK